MHSLESSRWYKLNEHQGAGEMKEYLGAVGGKQQHRASVGEWNSRVLSWVEQGAFASTKSKIYVLCNCCTEWVSSNRIL